MKNFLSFLFACLIAASGLIAAPSTPPMCDDDQSPAIENTCADSISDTAPMTKATDGNTRADVPEHPANVLTYATYTPSDLTECISVSFVNGQWQANASDVDAAIQDEWNLTSGQVEALHCCIIILTEDLRVTISHPDYGQFTRGTCQ